MATTVRSYSKINLGLAIGPTRADGFHSLATVYQSLALCDLVRMDAQPARETRIRLTTSLPEDDRRVPRSPKNTAWKMVEAALAFAGVTAEVSIHIQKQLPVQGGLGAGSANAVAALAGLARELDLPLTGAERLELAAAIGSDVPLFLIGGAVLGLGRGEQVFPLEDLPPMPCVVAVPEIGVSTPQAFRDWDARHSGPAGQAAGQAPSQSSGAALRASPVATAGAAPLTLTAAAVTLEGLSRSIAAAWSEPHSSGVFPPHSPSGRVDIRRDLAETPLLALVRTGIANDFEEVVFRQHPPLADIKRLLANSGHPEDGDLRPEDEALCAGLSGSGSALFGLYRTSQAADHAARRLADHGIRALRTETLPRGPYWDTMIVAT
jgi:4-diphosphocytidyl-2-C-methyl-D-erythritol kinase